MKRLIVALLVSPLWAPLLLGAYTWFYWPVPDLFPDMDRLDWTETAISATAVAGYVSMIVIGLPLHAFLRHRGYGSVTAYLLGWLVCTFIGWACAFLIGFSQYGMTFSSGYMAETIVHRPHVPILTGLLGMLIGASFWAIVRPGSVSPAPPPLVL